MARETFLGYVLHLLAFVKGEGPEIAKSLHLTYALLLAHGINLPPTVFHPFLNDVDFILVRLQAMEAKFNGAFAVGDAKWMLLSTAPKKFHPKAVSVIQ